MLQLSRGRGGRKADLRALAQQWGSKVVTLEELLTELKRLKPLPSAPAGTTGSSSSSSGARSPKGLSLSNFVKKSISSLYIISKFLNFSQELKCSRFKNVHEIV